MSNQIDAGVYSEFKNKAREVFAFLASHQFIEIEFLPDDENFKYIRDQFVRYRKVQEGKNLEIEILQEIRSFEIGLSIYYGVEGFSIADLIRLVDTEKGEAYRDFMAVTPEGVTNGLSKLADSLKQYGQLALAGDPVFFAMLSGVKKQWIMEWDNTNIRRERGLNFKK